MLLLVLAAAALLAGFVAVTFLYWPRVDSADRARATSCGAGSDCMHACQKLVDSGDPEACDIPNCLCIPKCCPSNNVAVCNDFALAAYAIVRDCGVGYVCTAVAPVTVTSFSVSSSTVLVTTVPLTTANTWITSGYRTLTLQGTKKPIYWTKLETSLVAGSQLRMTITATHGESTASTVTPQAGYTTCNPTSLTMASDSNNMTTETVDGGARLVVVSQGAPPAVPATGYLCLLYIDDPYGEQYFSARVTGTSVLKTSTTSWTTVVTVERIVATSSAAEQGRVAPHEIRAAHFSAMSLTVVPVPDPALIGQMRKYGGCVTGCDQLNAAAFGAANHVCPVEFCAKSAGYQRTCAPPTCSMDDYTLCAAAQLDAQVTTHCPLHPNCDNGCLHLMGKEAKYCNNMTCRLNYTDSLDYCKRYAGWLCYERSESSWRCVEEKSGKIKGVNSSDPTNDLNTRLAHWNDRLYDTNTGLCLQPTSGGDLALVTCDYTLDAQKVTYNGTNRDGFIGYKFTKINKCVEAPKSGDYDINLSTCDTSQDRQYWIWHMLY